MSEDVMTLFFWSSPDFGRKVGRLVMTFFFGVHLILRRKLDDGRRDDLFFGLHMILGRKLDVTLSVSRVWMRQPRSC